MEYRMVGTENLTRALFAHFIRRQEVTKCWRREAGEWVIRDVPFTDDWSEKDYATLFSELRELLSNGGIVITGVTANSPAAKAGIQVGDVILRLNKQDNLSIREMMQIISDTKPNTEVIVTVSRLGKVIDLPVVIEELPSN